MFLVRFAALSLVVASPAFAQAATGDQIFKQRCQACHVVKKGAPNGVGPNLAGVFGRKAAMVAKFNYSPALKSSKLVWTKDSLDKYLAAPTKLVPGTRMVMSVSDPAQRAALVGWLSKVK